MTNAVDDFSEGISKRDGIPARRFGEGVAAQRRRQLSRQLLSRRGEEGPTPKQHQYKQPFDQHPRFILQMLKIRILLYQIRQNQDVRYLFYTIHGCNPRQTKNPAADGRAFSEKLAELSQHFSRIHFFPQLLYPRVFEILIEGHQPVDDTARGQLDHAVCHGL